MALYGVLATLSARSDRRPNFAQNPAPASLAVKMRKTHTLTEFSIKRKKGPLASDKPVFSSQSQSICVPFCLLSPFVGKVGPPDNDWVGAITVTDSTQLLDIFLMVVLGGIPWQVRLLFLTRAAYLAASTSHSRLRLYGWHVTALLVTAVFSNPA